MPSTRRGFLASATAALFAGCLSSDDASDGDTVETTGESVTTTSPRTDTTTTDATTATGALDVSFVGYAVQRSAFWRRFPDFSSVWAPPDRQLLFAMVDVEGGRPSDLAFDRFSARVGDREVAHDSAVRDGDGDVAYPFPTTCDCRTEYATHATFPLPAPAAVDDAAVRWNGPDGATTWPLPDAALSALSAPTTRFELAAFDAPDRVGPDEPFEVGYEVRNVGDAPGTVRAVLNQEGPVYGVIDRHEEAVDAGESVVRRTTVELPPESDADEVKLRLRSVGGDADHAVAVDASTAESDATTTT